ncbi:hypothetical protein [Sporosarcina sp. NPDC096371]|uniref:hypothetical protein n=1 Tax=Sporosarcina sp. NPDC096371 TaxID=3364530 RepID=UPI0038040F2C
MYYGNKKKTIFLLVGCLVLFFALTFIQKDHILDEKSVTNTSIIENEILAIEVDEETNALSLCDSQGFAFSIPFSSIPIYEDYLQEQSDRKVEIERTSFELLPFNSSDGGKYGVLTYNCGVKLCSSLLVKLSNTFTSIELGYGMLMDMKQSPTLKSAVFRYGVNEGNVVLRNNMIPVNLEKMVLLNPVSKELSNEYIEYATWPITEYKWISEQKISMRVADVQDSEYDSLLTWSSGSKKTKEIEIELVE